MCIYSAVRTVAAAAVAAAVRHCTPATRGVFHAAAVLTINLIASCTSECSVLLKYTPCQNSRFCAASSLPIIIPYLSFRRYGHARGRRRASALRGEASLSYIYIYI